MVTEAKGVLEVEEALLILIQPQQQSIILMQMATDSLAPILIGIQTQVDLMVLQVTLATMAMHPAIQDRMEKMVHMNLLWNTLGVLSSIMTSST